MEENISVEIDKIDLSRIYLLQLRFRSKIISVTSIPYSFINFITFVNNSDYNFYIYVYVGLLSLRRSINSV